jgi:hypothetical protein
MKDYFKLEVDHFSRESFFGPLFDPGHFYCLNTNLLTISEVKVYK